MRRTRIRAAYDKAWLVARNDAHTKTLALIGREISGGSNAEVVAAAGAARPVVKMHLDMVRGGICTRPARPRPSAPVSAPGPRRPTTRPAGRPRRPSAPEEH
jgi:hypothetical protein